MIYWSHPIPIIIPAVPTPEDTDQGVVVVETMEQAETRRVGECRDGYETIYLFLETFTK